MKRILLGLCAIACVSASGWALDKKTQGTAMLGRGKVTIKLVYPNGKPLPANCKLNLWQMFTRNPSKSVRTKWGGKINVSKDLLDRYISLSSPPNRLKTCRRDNKCFRSSSGFQVLRKRGPVTMHVVDCILPR